MLFFVFICHTELLWILEPDLLCGWPTSPWSFLYSPMFLNSILTFPLTFMSPCYCQVGVPLPVLSQPPPPPTKKKKWFPSPLLLGCQLYPFPSPLLTLSVSLSSILCCWFSGSYRLLLLPLGRSLSWSFFFICSWLSQPGWALSFNWYFCGVYCIEIMYFFQNRFTSVNAKVNVQR